MSFDMMCKPPNAKAHRPPPTHQR